MRPAITSNIVSTEHLKILLLLCSQAGELPPLVLQTDVAQPATKPDSHVLRQLKHLQQLAATLLLPLTRTLRDALILGSFTPAKCMNPTRLEHHLFNSGSGSGFPRRFARVSESCEDMEKEVVKEEGWSGETKYRKKDGGTKITKKITQK